MIKSPKSKVQSPKSIKEISLLFIIGLFLIGCIRTQEYIYQEDAFKKVEEVEGQPEEKLEIGQEKWMDIYFEENNFIMQCPVCMRRYPGNVEKCPYDGANLDKIKE